MSETEACHQCGEQFKELGIHWALSDCDNPNALDYRHIALFSGGHDSLISTHYCMENDIAEAVVHLDTGTGIPENLDFVRDVCEEYGWPLEVYEAEKDFREFVSDWGFPKAGAHSWAYRYLKKQTLQTVARDCRHGNDGDKPVFYTGVYKDESSNRMESVTTERTERAQWFWEAPLAEWLEGDFREYMEENNLPKNPVVENIHRSGECFCGAYATRDEELIDLQAHYPEHAEWLLELENDVQEDIGTEEDYCWWGTSGLSSDELRELMESEGREDVDPILCRGCSTPN